MKFTTFFSAVFLAAGFTSGDTFSDQCQQFTASLTIPGVIVNVQEFVSNSTNITLPDNDPSCATPGQVVYGGDICRIALYVPTSNVSGINLEAWLPESWNGRFLSTGNGGLNGCIQYRDLAYVTSYGFGAIGANNGHNGTSGKPFLHAPEVVEDFAYRAIHTGVVVGKELVQQFYGKAANKSYYLGCSLGGRQGIKSAKMFPEDFDGIVAGAPATDFNALQGWRGILSQRAGFDNTSSDFVTYDLWQVVHKEILRQCDGLDGAVDGIIEDPDLCQPIFTTLLCDSHSENTSACLNAGQVGRVESIFSPLNGEQGQLLYPRLQPGAELAMYSSFFSGSMFAYSRDWMRYVVYNNSAWDPRTFSLADITLAIAQNPYNIATWPDDLSAFKSRGGKILTYHGMHDNQISSDNSARYYNHLAKGMSKSPVDLDSFYRYFRISGLCHCTNGPGAWQVGQVRGPSNDIGGGNPQDNVLLAVVDWVENSQSTGPEYVRGYFQNATAGTSGSRRHCRYPLRNIYKGSGEYEDEDNWKCV